MITGKTAGRNPDRRFPVATPHNINTYYTIKPPDWKSECGHGPPNRPKSFVRVPTTNSWFLIPVGARDMPSQTIHIPEQLYQYVITTKEDGQSTSARASELMHRGKAAEEGKHDD